MSEMGLPFDGAPPAETGGQRKKVVLLAAVAVLVLLLAVLVVPKLLASDSEPAAKPAAGAAAKTKKAPAKKKKAKAAAKPVTKPKPYTRAIANDPFKDVYFPPDERASDTATAPTPGSPASPGTGTGSGTDREFQLIDVKPEGSSGTVTVVYKGERYADLAVGQTFAENKFKVTMVTGGCAHFTYGELPFALCEGQYADFTSS